MSYCHFPQGHVIAVPRQSLDIVPIEILCHKNLETEKESHSIGPIKNLCQKALGVAESMKNRAPAAKRYHWNFYVLLQDILRSNDQLFTENEKTFLGTTSKSNATFLSNRFVWLRLL